MKSGSAGVRRAVSLVMSLLLAACNLPLDPGPPPRPTVIVITAEGPYYMDFVEASDWLIGDTEASTGLVANGAYHLSIKQPGTLAWTSQQRAFGDGVYEAAVRFITGPEASAFGILMLGASDLASFFYVMITADGRYDIGFCERSCDIQESLIGGFTLSYSILPGEQANHLRVELMNGQLSLAINGAPVSQVQGLSYTEGVLGLIGESSSYSGFEVAFENVQVTETGPPVVLPTPTITPFIITVTPFIITATPLPAATSPPLLEPTP